MEKRAILAVVLSVVVFYIFSMLMGPDKKQAAPIRSPECCYHRSPCCCTGSRSSCSGCRLFTAGPGTDRQRHHG